MSDNTHIASAQSLVKYLFSMPIKSMVEATEHENFQAEICASLLPGPLAEKIAHSKASQPLVNMLATKLDNTKVNVKAVNDVTRTYEKNAKMLRVADVK